MAGRKPKPAHLRLLEGKAGHRPIPTNIPEPEGDLKEAPDWFSEPQREQWDYAIKHAPSGLLKMLDQSALIAWACAAALHREAIEQVTAEGAILVSKEGGKYQNPWLAVANRQAQNMQKASAELGFTPSSRSRVSISNAGKEKQNPFARFKRD